MRNRCSYAGLVSAYFSVYLAGTKNVSTNTIYSYRDTFVIFHGYLEKYCGFKLEKLLHAKHKYDILFLDIRFNNCDIGIDVAKKLRKAGNTSLIILLTSLHSKAIEGYEIGAYRYIVKPIIKEKMYAVLDEAISSIRSNYRVILVKDMYNTVVVKIQQILYIYSNARKRCLVTLDGEIETWEQLKSIYEKLPQEQFAYAQKGFVVNYKMIKKLNKTGVELVNGENVPISRGMKNEFFANYFEFLGK